MSESELNILKREKLRRLTEERYRFFEPTGKGEEFIQKVGSGKYISTLFSAANGVSKTYTNVHMMANIFWPCGSQWFQQDVFKKWPYPKLGRIVTEPSKLTGVDSIIDNLHRIFPKGRYTTEKKGKNYEFYWKTDTGFEFDVMTFEQDVKEFEGPTLGFVAFDEPPPKRIYDACISRFRKGGIGWITETPVSANAAWMHDEFVADPEAENKGRAYVEASIESACKEHGVRGYLKHSDIERMVAQYSDEEKQARILGKFQHLTGLVFKQFSKEIHVMRPFNINPQDYAVYEFLDPHPRNPDAVAWYAVDSKGRKYVVDELWLKCQGGTAELAERIKMKADNYRIIQRFIDPSAFIEDQHTQSSLAQRLADLGLYYLDASKARTMSDRRIADALDFQTITSNGAVEFLKSPEIHFFDDCQRHIYEMLHYRWDEWKGRGADSKFPREKPVDKDDHMIENLGRFLFGEYGWVPYSNPIVQRMTSRDMDPYESAAPQVYVPQSSSPFNPF